MKQYLYGIIWAILQLSGILHGHTQELFLTANQLYKEQQYQKALATYETIALKSSAIWYNMGNCAFHLEEYAHALAYWLRALDQASSRQLAAIKHNVAQLSAHGISYTLPFFYYFTVYGSLLLFQILLLLSWFLLILSWRQRWYALMGIISMVFLFTLIGIYAHKELHRPRAVVVEKRGISLYSGPSTTFAQVGTGAYGTVGYIKRKSDGWVCLKTSSDCGWTSSEERSLLKVSDLHET